MTRPVSERAVLLAVGLGTTVAPLNSTMIAVALPRILAEFHAGVAASAWLVTAYLAAMAAIQPVAGTLGDRFGRRRLMLFGLAWFGVASLGAFAAGSLPLLVACRIQQGVAGAVALPNGAALVREILPDARRARGFGLIGALTGIAAAGGPPLGGWIVGAAGWRAMFLANVPVVTAALLLAWYAIPPVAARPYPAAARPAWSLPRLVHPRGFAAACAAVGLSNLAFYVTLIALPLLLAARPGASSAQTGAVLAVLLGASLCCTPLGGYLADRLGRRKPAVAGLLLASAGIAGVASLAVRAGSGGGGSLPLPALAGTLALAGAGMGLAGPGMQTAAVEAAGPQDAGAAAGLYSTSRYFGSIAGSAALAALADGAAATDAETLRPVFALVVAASALSVVASLGLRDRPDSPAVLVPPDGALALEAAEA